MFTILSFPRARPKFNGDMMVVQALRHCAHEVTLFFVLRWKLFECENFGGA